MAVLKILDVNQPSLRAKCKKVSRITPSEKRLLEDMVETMRAANGIGLAAPQIGVTQRLVVVEIEDVLYRLVNPEVGEASDETDIMREGCLSLPDYYGPVERPIQVTVRSQDQNGKKVKIKADGLLARALQHEIDHLDGILFFDPQRMRSLSDLKYEPRTEDDNVASDNIGGDNNVGNDNVGKVAERHPDAAGVSAPAANPPGRDVQSAPTAALTSDQEPAGVPA